MGTIPTLLCLAISGMWVAPDKGPSVAENLCSSSGRAISGMSAHLTTANVWADISQSRSARDMIDILMSVHRFDTFLTLIRDADLTFVLKNNGPYTMFAPTDDAFDSLPPGMLRRIHHDSSRLKQFVLHHVVYGSFTVKQVLKHRNMRALDGTRLVARNANGHGSVAGADFTIANVRARNGTLHGIDSVLTLK